MIPWKLIGTFAWKWFRLLAPLIAVLLFLVLIYNFGRNRGIEDLATARADITQLKAECAQVKVERDQARRDLEAANLKVLANAANYRTLERELRDAADAERIRLASSYGRALEEARAESAELRDRVASLEPGEACLVVMREMADAMR